MIKTFLCLHSKLIGLQLIAIALSAVLNNHWGIERFNRAIAPLLAIAVAVAIRPDQQSSPACSVLCIWQRLVAWSQHGMTQQSVQGASRAGTKP